MNAIKTIDRLIPALIALIAGCIMPVNTAYALPQDGVVAGGNATITQPNSTTMHINQATDKAIINWQGYSIQSNETVKYLMPSSNSISLNRVIGTNPSFIYGQLSANGRVWVINPNGLLIGQNAKINVGGFLASTLNITDQNFINGNYQFGQEAMGYRLSAITNQGNINAADGGYVVFISPTINNTATGSITANNGSVNMASGDDVTLTFADNGLINLVINKETAKDALGIDNSGAITADG
ncbi:MAG: filamentous hemagglutinin N-terminal domain-containing protein [Deltaproteobacteria bacterium]|nr:filamentous hemagglutinin N-terminal domain-containing protein [Deltaproteobacteria bacterium]